MIVPRVVVLDEGDKTCPRPAYIARSNRLGTKIWLTVNILLRFSITCVRQWKDDLVDCLIRCFMAAVLEFIFLVTGGRVSRLWQLLNVKENGKWTLEIRVGTIRQISLLVADHRPVTTPFCV